MADDINFDEGGAEGAAPTRRKGLGGLIPGLLKWILIALGAVILIVVVVFVTVRIVSSNTSQQTAIPVSDEYHVEREELDWYSSLDTIRTRTNDAIPATVVAGVRLGYKKEDKATASEITARRFELIDYLRRYFSQKTIAELQPQNEARIKIELRNGINDEILSKSKIRSVLFEQLDVIEQ
ncbi:MAG: flagellar basal body-associated FliL family protein [Treponema sp.]|nr:flagellar basal body-associated FliL family protein [Treponema sp.]